MDMMHIYMCIHMYIHVCECVCVCLCMCMCPCMKALISRTGAAGRSDGAGIGRWSPVELGRQRAQQVFYRPGRRHSASGTVCVCVCVCLYTRLFVYIHTHTHTHTHIQTHPYTHPYIYTYTYIYIRIYRWRCCTRTYGRRSYRLQASSQKSAHTRSLLPL